MLILLAKLHIPNFKNELKEKDLRRIFDYLLLKLRLKVARKVEFRKSK